MEIAFTAAALRQWTKLSADTRKRIRTKLVAFATSGTGDVKRLTGRGGARLRVGDWRVVFEQKEKTILVVAVGHRREIYE